MDFARLEVEEVGGKSATEHSKTEHSVKRVVEALALAASCRSEDGWMEGGKEGWMSSVDYASNGLMMRSKAIHN